MMKINEMLRAAIHPPTTLRRGGFLANNYKLPDFNNNKENLNFSKTSRPVKNNDEIKLSAEALALQGKKICIDPGHGGSDPGAIGPTGFKEKEVNLKIALYLKNYLEKEGATVIMTRATDADVAPPGSTDPEELGARVKIANENKTDILISIHNNANLDPKKNGIETYYYTYGSDAAKILSKDIYDKLVENLKLKANGCYPANFYVLKYADMPSVLTESAYISNAEEEILLKDPVFQEKIACSIAQGVEGYFKYLKEHPVSTQKPPRPDDGTWDKLV